jgi:drug/metabolite transporter (DMT)-like permease
MQFPAHLLFPLASSVAYVFAMLFFKRSGDWGVGVWRTAFVSNITIGFAFAPFWLLGGHDQPVTLLWQPLLVALLFLSGQIFSFLSLHYGDVSVGTPVMGLKIVLVALGSALLLPDPIPAIWWIAAALSTVAIVLLSRGDSRPRHSVGRTVFTAALGAASFALFDVLVQKWSPAWGVGRFLPITCGTLAVLSFGFVPFFKARLRAIPLHAWRWLGGGSLLLALQSSMFVYAIGAYGDATAMNIVYSSRGLWSVVAVRLIGHWFANEEQTLAPAILRSRLTGAFLILAAITLVVLR